MRAPIVFLRKAILAGLSTVMFSGCGSSPNFVHAPPQSYRMPIPAELAGVWAREGKDHGERAQVSALGEGGIRIDIYKLSPSAQDQPQPPIFAHAARFDNDDWLVVDLQQLAAHEGDADTTEAPYKLLNYILDGANRLCAILPSASRFAQGVQSGQIAGSVTTYIHPIMRVTVTSPAEDWIKWWSGLPAAEKSYVQPVVCFQRVG